MARKRHTTNYWDVIEEAFDMVDHCDGVRKYLKQIKHCPPHIRHLYAAHWCHYEIFNGGIDQLFQNPGGMVAPEGVVGLIAIGMPKSAAVLQRAMSRFGPRYPRSEMLRDRKWASLPKKGKRGLGGLGPAFDRFDDRYFDAVDAEGGFEKRAHAYAISAVGAGSKPNSKRPPTRARTKHR